MSNAKPMAAMMQISQAVRERAGAPEAAGVGAELMGGKRAANRRTDSSDDSGFLAVPAPGVGAQPPPGWCVSLPPRLIPAITVSQMKNSRLVAVLVTSSLLGCFSLGAATELSSWPEWRGTSGAGIAPGATPPTTWSDQKNIRWKTKIGGLGFSTPIIWKDRVYLLTAIETSEDRAPAPAAAPSAPAAGGDQKGKGGKKGGFGGGTKPTKVHEFSLVALDRKTGAIAWQKIARREVPTGDAFTRWLDDEWLATDRAVGELLAVDAR